MHNGNWLAAAVVAVSACACNFVFTKRCRQKPQANVFIGHTVTCNVLHHDISMSIFVCNLPSDKVMLQWQIGDAYILHVLGHQIFMDFLGFASKAGVSVLATNDAALTL